MDHIDYWIEHYTPNGMCCLCGNCGVLDARGVLSAAGHPCGAVVFCICPNGGRMRELGLDAAKVAEEHGCAVISSVRGKPS